MDDDQQFCLRWNNHQSTLISVFDTLLENETLVDCTLAAEGKFLKAHKVVLSACSPYFATLLQEQYDKHPIFILKDVKYQELRAMMDYMYRGEVNISQDQLAALLKAAESLQIKGLSDNRSGGSNAAPKPDAHHRVKLSGQYTLEQTKRARHATGGAMDAGDVSGSREGSSSPSRRRRKIRRRSMENDVHDNSNSSVLQAAASNQSILQQAGAGLTAAALVSTQLASGSSAVAANAAALASGSSQVSNQPLTSSSNVTKKTESAKLTSTGAAQGAQQQQQQQQTSTTTTSDAINTDNVQQQQQQQENQGAEGDADDMDVGVASAAAVAAAHTGVVKQLEKSNHKQKIKDNSIQATEMVIEPKAEYDDDAHDENVEDLTLDEEDMTLEELDQAAGTSQGGEGSSQAYGAWQHDRSQDDLGLMAAQDAQQRDPQEFAHGGHDASRTPTINRYYPQMHLKTSPYTSPIATPTGVIKYERSGSVLDDHEHELRIDSARATPTAHYNMPLRATGGNGNGGDNDDSNNNNDDDDEGDNDDDDSVKPYDLSVGLAKVYLAAAGVPGALGHHGHATSALLPSGHSSTGVDAKSSPANLMAATIAAMAANNTAAAAGGSGVVGGASTSAAAAMAAGLVASNQAACVANAAASGGSWSSAAGSAVGGGGAYACDRCGNTYARPHSLNRHVRFECGVEPQFECPICHKKSKHKHNLVLHMRTHQHR
ncbi:longitudinals lacking protein, isoforms H/M/V isoform X6 [Drosophila busckii]|uniref:longitudinals lacking protein, isoforms H/M/V isoform X6 n=1 Tax=Drosophila busckii TaxID=30019 RepID=UPI00083EAA17|nr:longitudinals lacking protein, isoforms H/M/V isoform X6 [Drosophila busckii]